MFESSVIELSKSALQSNINYIRRIIGNEIAISTVVKGNAYGHGISKFVELAESCGLKHFSVYGADEALRVFQNSGSNSEIMIMGWIDDPEIEWAIENNIQFYVFNFERLNSAIEVSKKINKKAWIHIELETGMNRVGFHTSEFKKLFSLLKENSEHIIIQGISTHYAGAESVANYVRIQKQHKRFKEAVKLFNKHDIIAHHYHTSSSAATMTYPNMRMDLVRIGILLYGFWPSPETFISHLTKEKLHEDPLTRVISWKSKIMSIKSVKMGEFIGYGNSYLSRRNMKVATIPVGYGHGFARSLSNSGRVLVKGQRADVVGVVNMNLVMIDITDIDGVEIGNEVVLIGNQGDKSITVYSFTEMSEQLNYELLTRLPESIPRRITE